MLAGREEIGEPLLHLAAGNAEPRVGLEQDRHLVVRLILVRNAAEVERADRFGELAALDEHLGEESVRKGKGKGGVERGSGVGFRLRQIAAAERRHGTERRCVGKGEG